MSFRDRRMPRGISLNPNGTYRVRVYYEEAQHSVGSYLTLSDAKAALAIARGQMARGTFVAPAVRRAERVAARAAKAAEQITVRDWADLWLDRLARDGRSAGTLASYRSTLRAHVLDMLGDMNLADVTPEHVDGLVGGGDMSPTVARNVLRTLSAMFNAAIKAHVGGVTVSPIRQDAVRPVKRRRDDAMPELADVRAIAEAMPERLRAAVWLAALCGLRLGEVLGLQRRDLDLPDADRAVVHIRRQWSTKMSPPAYAPPKAGSERAVAIPAALVPLLRDHLERFTAEAPESPVFASVSSPRRPVSQGSLDRYWRLAREPVWPGLHFHALRHVALTLYAREGATSEELLRRGGHSDARVAAIYQEATAERDRALTSKLNDRLRGVL